MKRKLNLENLILACIFFLPLYLWRVSFWELPSNAWETGAIIVIIAGVAPCFLAGSRQPHCFRQWFLKYVTSKKYLYPASLIFLGLLISTVANGNYAAGFGIIKSWFLVPLIFSLLAINLLREKKSSILWALYLSSLLVAIISLGYYSLGIVTYDGRLEAFFNSPNYLAMFLAPGIIIALAQISNIKYQIPDRFKTLFRISFLMISSAFYLTYSYAAWLSLLGAFFLVMFFSGKIKLKHILLSLGIFLAILFLQGGSGKFSDLVRFDERSSLSSRIMIWQSAGKMLEENWLLGIGPGNFQDKYLEYQKYYPPYLEWSVPHPHNIFLAFWLSGGILGIVGFMWLIYLFLGEIFSRKQGEANWIFAGIIFYFLLHGLFDTTYFKNDLAVIFWLAITNVIARLAPCLPAGRKQS
jgi:O-antigen ligase